MMVPPGKGGSWPTPEELHARRCFLLGIDPAHWPALWEEERKRVAEAESLAKKVKKQTKRRKGK